MKALYTESLLDIKGEMVYNVYCGEDPQSAVYVGLYYKSRRNTFYDFRDFTSDYDKLIYGSLVFVGLLFLFAVLFAVARAELFGLAYRSCCSTLAGFIVEARHERYAGVRYQTLQQDKETSWGQQEAPQEVPVLEAGDDTSMILDV